MSSTSTVTMTSTTAAGPRSRRIREYKDYLTPSLHRKFARAAVTVIGICYVEAVLIGDKSSLLWLFLPLGPAGLRTALLSIGVLILYLIRVSHLRFGQRTAVSAISDFTQLAQSLTLARTIGFYLFSAWWFSEVYMWSASAEADLSWTVPDEDNGRDRLNERAIILRTSIAWTAVVMACAHLYFDYDQIEIQQYPLLDGSRTPLSYKTGKALFFGKLSERLKFSAKAAAISTFVHIVVYAIGTRYLIWRWALWFSRLYWDIPRSSEPSTIPPYHYTLLFRAFASGFLLIALWETSNLAFSSWANQPPLKNNKPLTSDSNDPNGSLITGLRSHKSLVKTSALWELCLISTSFAERRKTIFSEVDRAGGDSTWKQILDSCLALIENMNTRLEDNRSPPPDLTLAASKEKEVKKLPRLSAPLKADPVVQGSPRPNTRTRRVETQIGTFAKSIGQSQTLGSDPTSTSPARKFLKLARDRILTPEMEHIATTGELSSNADSYVGQILRTVIGNVVQQTFARRVQAKIFGSPRSELPALLFATHSISQLAVAGILEDSLGTVNRDIPLIMRTFGNVITRIQQFIKESQSQSTDYTAEIDQSRRVEEVEFLLGYFKSALRHIIKGYEGYAKDMGIAPSELRAARLAAGLD